LLEVRFVPKADTSPTNQASSQVPSRPQPTLPLRCGRDGTVNVLVLV
jgi:hypothetical protein